MIDSAATISLVLLAVAALLYLVRLVRGPFLADRIIALDGLVVIIVCGLAIQAARTGDHSYLNIMVVAALLGFTGTAIVARFIERRGN